MFSYVKFQEVLLQSYLCITNDQFSLTILKDWTTKAYGKSNAYEASS